jgi:hypothetical protein
MCVVPVVVIVETDVVRDEVDRVVRGGLGPQRRHVVIGGLRIVDSDVGVERQAERHRHAVADQPGGGGDARGRQ